MCHFMHYEGTKMKEDPVKIWLQDSPEFHQLKSSEVFEEGYTFCCWYESHLLSQKQAGLPIAQGGEGHQCPFSRKCTQVDHPGVSNRANSCILWQQMESHV